MSAEALLERDPDPDAAMSGLIVRASRNLPEAKEEAWHALYVEQIDGGLARLEHDPEKWKSVFRENHAQTK